MDSPLACIRRSSHFLAGVALTVTGALEEPPEGLDVRCLPWLGEIKKRGGFFFWAEELAVDVVSILAFFPTRVGSCAAYIRRNVAVPWLAEKLMVLNYRCHHVTLLNQAHNVCALWAVKSFASFASARWFLKGFCVQQVWWCPRFLFGRKASGAGSSTSQSVCTYDVKPLLF
jgi:hypothetical protein